jgi:dipeptidyl aminopeptidase/acylaminoacyl peptidase
MKRTFLLLLALTQISWGQRTLYPVAKEGGTYMHNYYLPPSPGSYPWAPDWSPDGKSIAVSLLGSIWKVDVATGDAVQLTYDTNYHSSPGWSPDGKWLLYTSDGNNRKIQLQILNVASGQSHALTADDHLYLDPVFSPDGSRVAYVSTYPNGHFNLYVRPIRNGDWAGPPVALTTDRTYPRDRLYVGRFDMHIEPAWTPDGKSILFLSNRDVPLGSGNIWIMPAVENGIAQARPVLTEQTLFRARPDVSIDGKRFIYSSTSGAADQFNHLYVLPVQGGAPYKMTFGDHDDFHPRWSPDGEHIAYISNEGGLPGLVVMETYGGGKRRIAVHPKSWKTPMVAVHLEVVDETGSHVPARVQGVASDGKFYAPLDSYSRIGVQGQHFFHTIGDSTLWVPEGKLKLTAIKGLEHWPASAEVSVHKPAASVKLVVKRFVDLKASGWHSGSTHVHMNYGGNYRNTLENLMFMSRAEDQDILDELVANKDNRILDWMYFEPGGAGHSIAKKDPRMLVLVGEEYRPPFYGHMFFLGLRDHLISPFTTGYEGTGIESLYPSNTDMLRKAREQGAVTGYVHPWSGDGDPLDAQLGVGKGFPVDLALGVVDAYEWSNAGRGQMRVWSHAMNNDLRVTPTGGEDSISNLHISKPVGSLRTYGYLGSDFTASGWLTALRKGATFFTGGPLLEFEINGKKPGEEIRLPSNGQVKLHARAWSIAPLSKVVIYRNGQPFRELPVNNQPGKPCAELNAGIDVLGSAWYSLYAEGPYSELLDVRIPQAGTNAIRVYVGDQKIRNRESAEYFIRWIGQLKAMADKWPWWRSEAERKHVFEQFDEARKVYERIAAEKQ